MRSLRGLSSLRDLTPQFLRALSRLGGRSFYEVILEQTF